MIGLLVVVLILFALLVPGVGSQPAGKRIQCANNLKQIGLAVHNFHDTYKGLPPLALGDARASMFVLILPFGEMANVYNLPSGGNAAGNTSLANPIDGSSPDDPLSTWLALSGVERDAASSIRWMSCPSRRDGIQQKALSGKTDLYAGPLGDYAVVFIDQMEHGNTFPPPDTSPKSGWQLHQDPCDAAQVDRQKGAIRLAYLDCGEDNLNKRYQDWKPRDTFARITDGTSNTFIVGEKHVRSDELGRYSSSQDDQDGVYWFTSNVGGRNYNVARNIGFPLADGAKDKRFKRGQNPPRGPHADFGFGSWHNGVVQFLRADGSVHAISVSTNVDVLQRYGNAQDGITGCNDGE
jgi:hypothetical protein